MKKKLFLGIVFTITAMFYSCVKDLHNADIIEVTMLKGRVLEESEMEPLVNVKVIVTNGSTDYASTKTSEYGKFELNVNYDNLDGGNYLFIDAGSSGITKKMELKGMGQDSYDYGDIFLYNKNDGATPTITTSAVRDITASGAACGGKITSDGGAQVTSRGLCWNNTVNPDTSNSKVLCGSGIGEFMGNLTNLSPNTRYYVRAYATNSIGTAYGEQLEFITASSSGGATKPIVSTGSVLNISSNSAECGGNVTSDGGSSIIERGICWAQANSTHSPTISNYSAQASGTGTGTFLCTMTGLTANTDYYVRAYAKNAVGVAYGDSIQFTTLGGGGYSAPTVNTGNYSNLSSSSARCRGDVTSDGGSYVTYRGICYSTSPNPTIPHAPWGQNPEPNGTEYVLSGSGTGTFYCDLTVLSPNTLYYYRAFAGNQADESYGEVLTFTTLPDNNYPPDVYTYTVVYNTSTSMATGTGFIISDYGPISSCGFCWGTSPDVEIGNNPNVAYSSGPNSSGIFSCTFSNLSPGTTYYVRAFATNGFGTGYGFPKQLVIPNSNNPIAQ